MLYSRRYLTPVVSKYLARYPQARVELVLADRRVRLIPVHFVASPRLLSKYGTPSARELCCARCIGFSAFETWEAEAVKSRIDPVLTLLPLNEK